MKFGKEFKKQKVPEWTEAYVDYNGLKRVLQEIHQHRQNKQTPTPLRGSRQRLALHRTFSGLNVPASNIENTGDGLNVPASNIENTGDIEDQVIAVNMVHHENSRKLYNTTFLMSPDEGGESEIMFFKKLDDELNKVNTFYKDKVEEVNKEAALLNKQMEALTALRMKVRNPDFDGSGSLRRLSMDIDNTEHLRIHSPSGAETMGTDDSRLVETRLSNGQSDEPTACSLSSAFSTTNPSTVWREEVDSREQKTDHLDVLDRVKINNTLESPMSTIKSVLNDSREKNLSFNQQELREVEGRLKLVFIEFYRKLRLLKHYSFVNLAAFSKIMKKYEKIALRSAARAYMKMVDDSYLGSSDEVTGLLGRVEVTFIKYFSNANRREGMKSLRPKQKREKHSITFFSGFFFGCTIALLVAIVLLVHARKVIVKEDRMVYMDSIFPLYSLYAYIVLHMLLYAANIYFWRRSRINYSFIFGFKQGTELSYRDVFLLSSGLAMLALTTFLIHLHMKMDSRYQEFEKYIELVPLGLVTVVLAITFCPFNIIYKSSRLFFIRCAFRCICAPLYKVTFPDFFLADQLTSQVQAIRSFEFYICFYGLGGYKYRNKCHSHDLYNVFYFIMAVLPYWVRFLQCVRRLFEEKEMKHIFNGSRYFLTIIAVVIRTAFELKKSNAWKVMATVSSVAAILFNTYWDIVVDWGLLRRKSKNSFLREKLIISRRSIYFAAMVLDVGLRCAWLQLVFILNVRSLRVTALSSIFACLEILRRGIWNFFRLENEHLNNIGKYRAFKSVPLPFNYYDENSDKDD